MFPGRGGGGRSEAVRGWPLSARMVSVGEVLPPIIPVCCWAAAAAAAATACCCWMSFLEALPRFFLSRAYSHFSVKSDQPSTNHPPKKQRLEYQRLQLPEARKNSPTQCWHGSFPSHFVRSWLHWSQALLILRRIGPGVVEPFICCPLILPVLLCGESYG